jgi:hypothetical protein
MKNYCLHFNRAFSLTPALSRRERENRFQSQGKSKTGFCSIFRKFYKHAQRLFPLPTGEGQGEGRTTQ